MGFFFKKISVVLVLLTLIVVNSSFVQGQTGVGDLRLSQYEKPYFSLKSYYHFKRSCCILQQPLLTYPGFR